VLSLVDNYENYGGKKQYVEWARSQGQSITSEDDFFTNSLVKGFFKNHIKVRLFFLIFIFTFLGKQKVTGWLGRHIYIYIYS
jgi:hypothetical protein